MSGGEILGLVLVGAAYLSMAVINALKGKYWFALLALLGPGWLSFTLGVTGAIRLAKPNSRWARRYDEDKMLQAMNRFPTQAAAVDPDWMENAGAGVNALAWQVDQIGDWPDENPALWDKTTRRAYKKQHGHWPEDAPPGG